MVKYRMYQQTDYAANGSVQSRLDSYNVALESSRLEGNVNIVRIY